MMQNERFGAGLRLLLMLSLLPIAPALVRDLRPMRGVYADAN